MLKHNYSVITDDGRYTDEMLQRDLEVCAGALRALLGSGLDLEPGSLPDAPWTSLRRWCAARDMLLGYVSCAVIVSDDGEVAIGWHEREVLALVAREV